MKLFAISFIFVSLFYFNSCLVLDSLSESLAESGYGSSSSSGSANSVGLVSSCSSMHYDKSKAWTCALYSDGIINIYKGGRDLPTIVIEYTYYSDAQKLYNEIASKTYLDLESCLNNIYEMKRWNGYVRSEKNIDGTYYTYYYQIP